MSSASRPTCLAELNGLSRGQLQRLAKDCNIRANAKSADLRRLVAAHLNLGPGASSKAKSVRPLGVRSNGAATAPSSPFIALNVAEPRSIHHELEGYQSTLRALEARVAALEQRSVVQEPAPADMSVLSEAELSMEPTDARALALRLSRVDATSLAALAELVGRDTSVVADDSVMSFQTDAPVPVVEAPRPITPVVAHTPVAKVSTIGKTVVVTPSPLRARQETVVSGPNFLSYLGFAKPPPLPKSTTAPAMERQISLPVHPLLQERRAGESTVAASPDLGFGDAMPHVPLGVQAGAMAPPPSPLARWAPTFTFGIVPASSA